VKNVGLTLLKSMEGENEALSQDQNASGTKHLLVKFSLSGFFNFSTSFWFFQSDCSFIL